MWKLRLAKATKLAKVDKHNSGGYWDIISNRKKFFDEISSRLKIKKMSDWYKVSSQVRYRINFILNLI